MRRALVTLGILAVFGLGSSSAFAQGNEVFSFYRQDIDIARLIDQQSPP